MAVRMRVDECVGMDLAVMSMNDGMTVLMSMLSIKCVHNGECCSDRHDKERNSEEDGEMLTEK